MPEGVPNNLPVQQPSQAPVTISQKTYTYANVTNAAVGYVKFDVVSSQVRRNGATGVILGTDWVNESKNTALTGVPVLSELSAPPSDYLVDNGDPVVLNVPDTAGGTAGALPALTNYVSIYMDQSQPNGVNYTVSGTAPIVGAAPNTGLELSPGGSAPVVSGADLANLKFISKVAGATPKVVLLPFVKLVFSS